MSVERYTLDANILVYAMDPDAGEKNKIARALWFSLSFHDCLLSVQTLAETYNVIARKLPARRSDAVIALSELAQTVPVVHAAVEDWEEAMLAHRSRPVHFWDAMLWATVRSHGCKTIWTENLPDRATVGGVRYRNPFLSAELPRLPRPIPSP